MTLFGSDNGRWKDIDMDKVKYLYINEKRSFKYISEIIGVSRPCIKERLTKENVELRTRDEQQKQVMIQFKDSFKGINAGIKSHFYKHGRKIGVYQNCREYRELAKNKIEWKCQICGNNKTKHDLCVHHIDKNNHHNSIDNLMVLCKSCHSKIHTKGEYK